MPAPFAIDSNRTGLIVWSCDDNGNVVQAGGVTMPALVTSGSLVLSTGVAGDPFPRFQLAADGTMAWGSGTAVPATFLARGTTGGLLVTVGAAAGIALATRAAGDTANRWQSTAAGTMSWGDGTTAVDTNLYRYAAAGLATDSALKLAAAAILLLGAAGDTNLYRQAGAAVLSTDNDFAVNAAGKGLQVKEGANAKMGTAVLVAGTAVVATTAVKATSRVFLTAQSVGGTAGALAVTARVAGTSFTITSTNAADTSTVAWLIVDPA